MKQLAVTILAFLYLFTSTGVIVHLHNCVGNLSNFTSGQNKHQPCHKCEKEQPGEQTNGCCKSEYQFIKSNNEQAIVSPAIELMQSLAAPTSLSSFDTSHPGTYLSAEKKPASHAPPKNNGIAIYKRNRVFRL